MRAIASGVALPALAIVITGSILLNLRLVPVLRDFRLIPGSGQADAYGAACLRVRGKRG
ncbi:hypothetical protein GCM10023155_11990 [Bremerella cremea]